ncbi:hypothetical protein CHARACLAT_000124 [Characodon lateralis]|uniref:Uncharacterized protein n=1 Tax=Characodon lateralis TaxID=208331 RepID=A0ABU7EQ53_9TELE|nr:hypothetical protein [Characodon lateralis]
MMSQIRSKLKGFLQMELGNTLSLLDLASKDEPSTGDLSDPRGRVISFVSDTLLEVAPRLLMELDEIVSGSGCLGTSAGACTCTTACISLEVSADFSYYSYFFVK